MITRLIVFVAAVLAFLGSHWDSDTCTFYGEGDFPYIIYELCE